MVVSLGGHIDLHLFQGGTLNGLKYRDEVLIRPYVGAIGKYFILMDDNAQPHRSAVVDKFLEGHSLERIEWPVRSPDLNLIEHLLDYLGRQVVEVHL